MSRTAARVAAVVVLAVLSAGCQARLALDITVDRDGGGELALVLGADEALLSEARARGADPLGDLAAVGASLRAAGWRTRDEHDDAGGRAVTLAVPFDSPEELTRLAAELGEALAAPELVPLEDLRLDVGEDEVRFTGVAGLVPQPAVTEWGLQPEQAVALLRDTDGLRLDVAVALPGEVLATNAATGGGAEPLRWRIGPGERVELLAVSERPRGAWWALALAGAAGGLVVLLLVALALGWTRATRQRRVGGEDGFAAP